MKVWILTEDVDYEGGSIVDVFDGNYTLDEIKEYVLEKYSNLIWDDSGFFTYKNLSGIKLNIELYDVNKFK